MEQLFKVLHLIPTLEGGGAERQLAMLAREQASLGYEVHIGLRRRDGVYAILLLDARVVIHELGDLSSLDPRLLLSINSLVRKINPNVIQTWLPQMDIAGGLVALYNLVPLVTTERASRLAFKRFNLITWLRRFVGAHANAIVANSTAGAEYWRDILSTKILLKKISNAVDVNEIRSAELLDSSKLFHANEKVFLVVGRLNHQKAVEVVLHAISMLPKHENLKLLIVGDGPENKNLQELIVTLNILDNVVMLPFQANWWGLLKYAVGLISMSRFEGNPNVVLEAMAAGCPLIVSDIPEHREILSEQSAIFVPVENSHCLKNEIKNLLADPLSAQIRANQAAKYVDRFTIELTASAYEKVYHRICCGDRGF
ncbi:glycosyltransferase [Polynucleobacter paneuropaeus]|nr:glycosyltransferase [Polynucleobacter paneuropaeus]